MSTEENMNEKEDEIVVEEILEERHFSTPAGKVIMQRENQMTGELTYVGSALLQVPSPNGPQRIPLRFDIKADSLQDAFSVFDEKAQEEKAVIEGKIKEQQEAARNRIAVPGQGPMTPPPAGVPSGNGPRLINPQK